MSVTLVYQRLASPDLSLARVATSVLQVGHDGPAEVILRRFGVGWQNFETVYKQLVDCWALDDNSGDPPFRISSVGEE